MISAETSPEWEKQDKTPLLVGVLSDTHGRLHPEVRESLEGVAHIIHAGDVGSAEVVTALKALAPVTAVRGNCDFGSWARDLPTEAEVELGGARILVSHIGLGWRDNAAHRRVVGREGSQAGRDRRPDVVITGHTHRAELSEVEGVLYLNPGSAGPQRFGRSRTVALLRIFSARAGAAPRVEAESLVVGE